MKEFRFCPYCGRELSAGKEPGAGLFCENCSFTAGREPRPGVALLIHDKQERILLGKRKRGSYREGLWSLPGGELRGGEDYRSAAFRQARQLTGLCLEQNGVYNVVSGRDEGGRESLVVVVLAYAPHYYTATPGGHFEELVWFAPTDDLPPTAFESDGLLARRFRSGNWTVLSQYEDLFEQGGGI